MNALRMKFDDGLFCPVIICEHCLQQIVDTWGGYYLWLMDKDGKPTGSIYFCHDKCHDDFVQYLPGVTNGENKVHWHHIGVFVVQLGANLGIDWESKNQVTQVVEQAKSAGML